MTYNDTRSDDRSQWENLASRDRSGRKDLETALRLARLRGGGQGRGAVKPTRFFS